MADNGVNPPGEAQFDKFEEVQAGVEPGGRPASTGNLSLAYLGRCPSSGAGGAAGP